MENNQYKINKRLYYEIKQVKNLLNNLNKSNVSKLRFDEYNLGKEEAYYKNNIFEFNEVLDEEEQKAIATFVYSAVGDALGVHTEFEKYKDKKLKIENINDLISFYEKKPGKRCELGEFSDDTAMALCLADSLLFNDEFDPIDLRIRFLLWWYNGYNNCRNNGIDNRSFGLGGNIHESFQEFIGKNFESEYFEGIQGNQTNGNGSLMRNASIPLLFFKDFDIKNKYQKCMEWAKNQSRTTHSGEEAYDCCVVLSFLIILNIKNSSSRKQVNNKKLLDDNMELLSEQNDLKFCYPVKKLIKSEKEDKDTFEKNNYYVKEFNKSVDDRDWNWKSDYFEYSKLRREKFPGYIGSYCMDALSMALHIVYHSESATEAILKAVKLGGDADTVACIVGQLSGSIWGYEKELLKFYEDKISKNDNYKCARIAHLLYNKTN